MQDDRQFKITKQDDLRRVRSDEGFKVSDGSLSQYSPHILR